MKQVCCLPLCRPLCTRSEVAVRRAFGLFTLAHELPRIEWSHRMALHGKGCCRNAMNGRRAAVLVSF